MATQLARRGDPVTRKATFHEIYTGFTENAGSTPHTRKKGRRAHA